MMRRENLMDVAEAGTAVARSGSSVRMAALSSRMEGIARKMQNTLFRTARFGALNTTHDFSWC
jgi:N-methylhydantoinase B